MVSLSVGRGIRRHPDVELKNLNYSQARPFTALRVTHESREDVHPVR